MSVLTCFCIAAGAFQQFVLKVDKECDLFSFPCLSFVIVVISKEPDSYTFFFKYLCSDVTEMEKMAVVNEATCTKKVFEI